MDCGDHGLSFLLTKCGAAWPESRCAMYPTNARLVGQGSQHVRCSIQVEEDGLCEGQLRVCREGDDLAYASDQ